MLYLLPKSAKIAMSRMLSHPEHWHTQLGKSTQMASMSSTRYHTIILTSRIAEVNIDEKLPATYTAKEDHQEKKNEEDIDSIIILFLLCQCSLGKTSYSVCNIYSIYCTVTQITTYMHPSLDRDLPSRRRPSWSDRTSWQCSRTHAKN